MVKECSTNWGEKRNTYRILVGKPEGRRPLERIRRRWVREIERDGVDWIDLTQGPCEQGNEPSGSIIFWEILE
jgi:hypothetical protein